MQKISYYFEENFLKFLIVAQKPLKFFNNWWCQRPRFDDINILIFLIGKMVTKYLHHQKLIKKKVWQKFFHFIRNWLTFLIS